MAADPRVAWLVKNLVETIAELDRHLDHILALLKGQRGEKKHR